MKRPPCLLFQLLLFLLFCSLPFSVSAQSTEHSRPRVGVVLSGGGAKGVAHIGVLRALEEAHVPIDYIAGTSMGAIVGGLYAMGYTTAELDTLVRTQDWEFLLSDKTPRRQLSPVQRERAERYVLSIPLSRSARPELTGLVRGRNLGNLLARLTVGYHDSISFDQLPIPFACVATNLANGDEIVFRNGIPATAIRASMAIPGAFTPVIWQGKTLVDGGMVNNFPVDVARKMGADIVIGSTVQRTFADTMETGGLQAVIHQLISIASRRKFEDNIRNCDIHIRVNPKGVSTMDFTAASIDTMLRRGYQAALQQQPALRQLMQRLYPDTADASQQMRPYVPAHGLSAVFPIARIRFDQVTPAEERAIRRATGLCDSTDVTQAQIEQAVLLLNERFLYLDANYSLNENDNRYDLVFHAHRRLASQVGVGARFDTEELASLLLDADVVFKTRVPSELEVSARLSEQYAVRASYTIEPLLNRQLNFYYDFHHRDMDVYQKGNRAYNLVYQQQQAGLSFAYRQTRNFDAELGVQVVRHDFNDILLDEAAADTAAGFRSDTYFTGFFRLRYNSQDRSHYPTIGSKFFAEYAFTTDNLTHLRRPHSFSSVLASWETVFPLAPRWALLPRFSTRMLLAPKVPFLFRNAIGGYTAGKYVEQQLPFVGLSHWEAVRNVFVMADFRLRYHFLQRHYATCLGALLAEHRDFRHLRCAAYHYGVGLQYGYDSKFGPVEAGIAYSGRCRKPKFYLSVGFDF